MRFILSLFFILSTLSAQNTTDWSVVTTADNMTMLINLSSVPTIGGTAITTNDTIGVFYTQGTVLKCGGKIAWNGNVNQAISFPSYKDDSSTPLVDGFVNNNTFVWKVKKGSTGATFSAIPQYNTTGLFDSVFVTDGFAQITNLNIISTTILGCTDPLYLEYNPTATVDDGSCATLKIEGCTDVNYLEYNPNANFDDGSCLTLKVEGCTDTNYLEYNPNANSDDGSCATLKVEGCTDANYLEYNPNANVDDGSCLTLKVEGCTDTNYLEYNPNANFDDGSCVTLKVYGCTDTNYFNYNANANIDDGSCDSLKVYGCTNETAQNYNASANFDDGSCDFSCEPGKVQVIVKVFPKKTIQQSFFLTESGNVFFEKNGNQLNSKDSLIYYFCLEENKNIYFNSNGLDSFAIINCGLYVNPSQVNPENASFLTSCNTQSVNDLKNNVSFNYTTDLNLSIHSDKKIDIQIVNILGKNLMHIKNVQEQNIDLKQYPKGIYLVTISDDKNRFTKKITVR